MKLDQHPTVIRVKEKMTPLNQKRDNKRPESDWLKELCLAHGVDDVGFVHIDNPGIAHERNEILSAFPKAKTLISIAGRASRGNARSPVGHVAYIENHHVLDRIDAAACKISKALEHCGITAMIGGGVGFPLAIDSWPNKSWLVSHKPVAVAAGIGQIGLHRNVIHPKFGSFIGLGTILIDAEVSNYGNPIDFNPCFDCKLCVEVCPAGALGPDGYFNFSACFMVQYRELVNGFFDWVMRLTESRNYREYRRKYSDAETLALWQSLTFKSNYKSCCCMAVCPAGEDVIFPFLENKDMFIKDIVKPLQEKEEIIHVIPGSDAEVHVKKYFPNKKVKRVPLVLRPSSVEEFIVALPLLFQPNKSKGVSVVLHFSFTGMERQEITITVKDNDIKIERGGNGTADAHVVADSSAWVRLLAKDMNIFWALLRRKIRFRGSFRSLREFMRCFPL